MRVGGRDRTTTSVKVAEDYRRRAVAAGGVVETVIVATSRRFPDGLAASALAGKVGAPVLLTGIDRLADEVAGFIERYSISRVYVMGGPEAVSSDVERSLEALDPVEVLVRLGGADRYETAALLAEHVVYPGSPAPQCSATASFTASHTTPPVCGDLRLDMAEMASVAVQFETAGDFGDMMGAGMGAG